MLLGNLSLRAWAYIGAGIVIALLLATIVYLKLDNSRLEAVVKAWETGAESVVEAVREASGNDKVEWSTAAGQIRAIGDSNRQLKLSIKTQNQRIDEMAAEAVRLKAKATELKKIADRAQAQRAAALRKLSDMALTPGARDDCMQLLKEAEDALDLVRSAGA